MSNISKEKSGNKEQKNYLNFVIDKICSTKTENIKDLEPYVINQEQFKYDLETNSPKSTKKNFHEFAKKERHEQILQKNQEKAKLIEQNMQKYFPIKASRLPRSFKPRSLSNIIINKTTTTNPNESTNSSLIKKELVKKKFDSTQRLKSEYFQNLKYKPNGQSVINNCISDMPKTLNLCPRLFGNRQQEILMGNEKNIDADSSYSLRLKSEAKNDRNDLSIRSNDSFVNKEYLAFSTQKNKHSKWNKLNVIDYANEIKNQPNDNEFKVAKGKKCLKIQDLLIEENSVYYPALLVVRQVLADSVEFNFDKYPKISEAFNFQSGIEYPSFAPEDVCDVLYSNFKDIFLAQKERNQYQCNRLTRQTVTKFTQKMDWISKKIKLDKKVVNIKNDFKTFVKTTTKTLHETEYKLKCKIEDYNKQEAELDIVRQNLKDQSDQHNRQIKKLQEHHKAEIKVQENNFSNLSELNELRKYRYEEMSQSYKGSQAMITDLTKKLEQKNNEIVSMNTRQFTQENTVNDTGKLFTKRPMLENLVQNYSNLSKYIKKKDFQKMHKNNIKTTHDKLDNIFKVIDGLILKNSWNNDKKKKNIHGNKIQSIANSIKNLTEKLNSEKQVEAPDKDTQNIYKFGKSNTTIAAYNPNSQMNSIKKEAVEKIEDPISDDNSDKMSQSGKGELVGTKITKEANGNISGDDDALEEEQGQKMTNINIKDVLSNQIIAGFHFNSARDI